MFRYVFAKASNSLVTTLCGPRRSQKSNLWSFTMSFRQSKDAAGAGVRSKVSNKAMSTPGNRVNLMTGIWW